MECESTLDVARKRAAWWIVSAVRQVKGRGRFNRTWYGEPGGLWATYNVPIDPQLPLHWGVLPLVAGAAIMRALRPFGIDGLRLRWPNDVLVGRSKLAGILVERPAERLAAIGIGVNVLNDVQSLVGQVQDTPTRLADCVQKCPSVVEVRDILAAALGEVYLAFVQNGFAALASELSSAWGGSRSVEVITDAGSILGLFTGVVDDGSPVLCQEDGTSIVVPGIEVLRMKEL